MIWSRRRKIRVFLWLFYISLSVVAGFVWVFGIGTNAWLSLGGMLALPLLVYFFRKAWGWMFWPEEADERRRKV